MMQRKTMALVGLPGLLFLGACSQDTSAAAEEASNAEETGNSEEPAPTTDTAEDAAPDPALAAVAAGQTFYEEQACASCHVEGVDDVMAPPGLRGVDAGSLLAFMDGTAPHSAGVTEGVTEDDAANLEAYLATL